MRLLAQTLSILTFLLSCQYSENAAAQSMKEFVEKALYEKLSGGESSRRLQVLAGAVEGDSMLMQLESSARNEAPMVEEIPDQSHAEGDVVDMQVRATDVDGDPLTYGAMGLPPGLTIGPSSGRISGEIRAGAADSSPYTVTLMVSDGIHEHVEQLFTWSVGGSSGRIAFVGSTSYESGESTVSSFTLDLPTGVEEGDLLMMSMFHGAHADPEITAPVGWRELYKASSFDGGMHTIFYRVATSLEPVSYMWKLSETKHPAAGLVAYRGVNTTTPFHTEAEKRAIDAKSITLELSTLVDETRLLIFTAIQADEEGASPQAGLIERYDEYAFTRTAALADEPLYSAGTVKRSITSDDPNGGNEIFAFAITLLHEKDEDPMIPTEFVLHRNYPNPATTWIAVSLDLSENSDVSIEVYDLLGRQVLSVPTSFISAGIRKKREIDVSDLASGTYVYQVNVRSNSRSIRQASKFVLIK